MGLSRPRYNKAREEQMRARKAGKRKAEDDDGNAGAAEMITPKTAAEKMNERYNREMQRAAEQAESKMTSKKRKRLDNYVNKKLKQERRAELFKSLADSQNTLGSSLQLQPSSSLGSKQFKTNQDKLDKVSTLSARKRARVHHQVGQLKKGYHSDDSDEDRQDERRAETPEIPQAGPSRLPAALKEEPVATKRPRVAEGLPVEAQQQATVQQPTVPSLGSGLSLGVNGQPVKPTVRARQKKAPIERRRYGKKLKPHLAALGLEADDDDNQSDSSFDSSDSQYDTSDEDDEGDDTGSNSGETETGANGSDQESSFSLVDDEEEWAGIQDSNTAELVEEHSEEPANALASTGQDVSLSENGMNTDDGNDTEAESEDGSEDDEDSPISHSESESDETDAQTTSRSRRQITGRKFAFKSWANEQLGIVTRSTEGEPLLPTSHRDHPTGRILEGPVKGPLGEDLVLPTGSLLEPLSTEKDPKKRMQRTIVVERSEAVQEKRLELPILAEEDTIMEAIRLHSVVVICGETGSGKTTQLPQFLYEAGFGSSGTDNPGMIGTTQPRRVAAMSMAQRVGEELALPPSKVSYQIRYDATTSSTTSIKFMTDGVLLRELANDFLLTKYSVIIVDEAHERSVNTDVLIGTLTRVVRLREELWREGKNGTKPLRMVIMSATLRVTDFTENKTLFKVAPPVINVSARQHPVTLHFNRKTRPDYLKEAYSKVSKIHARLPPGGILVFLTGQNEIVTLCKRLEKRFGTRAIRDRQERRMRLAMGTKAWQNGQPEAETDENSTTTGPSININAQQGDVEAEEVDFGDEQSALAADVDDGTAQEEDPEALDSDHESEDDPDGLFADKEEECDTPLHVLPLYSLLATDKQMRVFKPPPEGHRLVVIATNVAETSLTIPNIRYVVDCGMAKERHYDQGSNVQSFDVSWISKAGALQRAGRAGRTGPGHCYRLYSSNVFETQFPQHSVPEILRMPIEGIVLQMKSMNIDQVVNFPFPTPPDRAGLQSAEQVLINLGALTPATVSGRKVTSPARITELGQAMSVFPLSPRFSKMLVTGQQHGCLPYVIAVVSALSVGDPFVRAEAIGAGTGEEEDDKDDDALLRQLTEDGTGGELAHIRSEDVKAREVRKLARRAYYQVQQLHSGLGKGASDVFKMLSVVGAYEYGGGTLSFCEQNYVRSKAMQEIHKLRAQITNIVRTNYPSLGIDFDPQLLPPSETQLKVIRQLLTAAFVDQIAIRKDLVSASSPDYGKHVSARGVPYAAVGVAEDVFIHPSSVLFHNAPPEAVVYQELIRTSRPYIRVVTKTNTAWLPTLGKPLCTFSRVLEAAGSTGAKEQIIKKTTGPGGSQVEERECYVVPKFGGFDNLQLAPVKVLQRRIGGRLVFA